MEPGWEGLRSFGGIVLLLLLVGWVFFFVILFFWLSVFFACSSVESSPFGEAAMPLELCVPSS